MVMVPYVSVCSGIEAFSVAVQALDFEPVAFSEIEEFPSLVLAHRFPKVPNLGDFTTIDTTKLGHVGWLAGGTPCQSFSVAGLRKGLADDRGNLTLEFVRLAHALQQGNGLRGFLWENVPGVLSDKSNAFGCFLGGVVGHDGPLRMPGGGRWPNVGMVAGARARLAWRVLDSRHFGVAQRRKRVFVVADFGGWFDPATVLFEPRGKKRRAAARSQEGQEIAGTLGGSSQAGGFRTTDLDNKGAFVVTAPTLRAGGNATGGHRPPGSDVDTVESLVVSEYLGNAEGGNQDVPSLNASNGKKTVNNQTALVVWSLMPQNSGKDFKAREVEVTQPIMAGGPSHGNQGGDIVQNTQGVRRLIPEECEKLQGLPVGWTRIPGLSGWRKVGDDENVAELEAAGLAIRRSKKSNLIWVNDPDGPRYKSIGNSFTTEPVNWIMSRVQASLRGEPMPDWQPMRLWAKGRS